VYESDRHRVERCLVVGENMRVHDAWIGTVDAYAGVVMDGRVECGRCGLGIQTSGFAFLGRGGGFCHIEGGCPK
jgi:hypothetical protein